MIVESECYKILSDEVIEVECAAGTRTMLTCGRVGTII